MSFRDGAKRRARNPGAANSELATLDSGFARYARARNFPIIPCNLCGSQQHLKRRAVKELLAGWERDHPGRTEAIFSALRNVQTSHLADPAAFDFAGLDARSTPADRDAAVADTWPPPPVTEPWDAD